MSIKYKISKRFRRKPSQEEEEAIHILALSMKKNREEFEENILIKSFNDGIGFGYFLDSYGMLKLRKLKRSIFNILLNSSNHIARKNAAFIIGTSFKVKFPIEGLKALIFALKTDNDPDVRATAIEGLTSLVNKNEKIKKKEAVAKTILHVLKTDKIEIVRSEAARSLGNLNWKQFIPELVDTMLNDTSQKVRESAVIALTKVSKCDTESIISQLSYEFPNITKLQKQMWILESILNYTFDDVNKTIILNFIKQLWYLFNTTQELKLRILLLKVLRKCYVENVFIEQVDFTSKLNQLIKEDSNTEITENCLESLKGLIFISNDSIDLVLHNLKHKNHIIRETALITIGDLLIPKFEIMNYSTDSKKLFEYEKNMLDFIQKPKREEIIKALIEMIQHDKNRNLRIQAISFLIKTVELNPIMSEKHTQIMYEYEQRRKSITKEIELILLNDKDSKVQIESIKALAILGYWESKEIIKQAQNENESLTQVANEAQEKIGLTIFEAYPDLANELIRTKQTDIHKKLIDVKLIDAKKELIQLVKSNTIGRKYAINCLTRFELDAEIEEIVEYTIYNDPNLLMRFKALLLFPDSYLYHHNWVCAEHSILSDLARILREELENDSIDTKEATEITSLLIEKYNELGLPGEEEIRWKYEHYDAPISLLFWSAFAILKMKEAIPLIKRYCYESDYQGYGDYYERDDPWAYLRLSAVTAVGKIGGDEAVKILEDRLKDGYIEIAENAISFLSEIDSKEAMKVLYKLKYRIIEPYFGYLNFERNAADIIDKKGLGENLEIFFDFVDVENRDLIEYYFCFNKLRSNDVSFLISIIENGLIDKHKILASGILRENIKITKTQQQKLIQLLIREPNIVVKKAIFFILILSKSILENQETSVVEAEKIIQAIEKHIKLTPEYYKEIVNNDEFSYYKTFTELFALISSKANEIIDYSKNAK